MNVASTVPSVPMLATPSLMQELLDLEDWRPLSDEEVRAWVRGELDPAPDGQTYGISPCGLPVIYRTVSLEAAVVSLFSAGAWRALTAVLDSPDALGLHAAARVDVCLALGDHARAMQALDMEEPAAREYVLERDLHIPQVRLAWLWARDIARVVIARQAADAALDQA